MTFHRITVYELKMMIKDLQLFRWHMCSVFKCTSSMMVQLKNLIKAWEASNPSHFKSKNCSPWIALEQQIELGEILYGAKSRHDMKVGRMLAQKIWGLDHQNAYAEMKKSRVQPDC